MKTHFSLTSSGGRSARWTKCVMAALAAAATLLAVAGAASARPVISHDPVLTAVKGEPLGLRATVRDATGRISSVSVFYASSRGMTPFRRDLTTTGAGIWYGTIPGHLIGPGSNLFYYVHADNIEGDSTDTEWVAVNVIEPGMSAADMPTVQAVARESQLAAAAAATTAPTAEAQPAPAAPSKPAAKSATRAAPKTASRAVAPSAPESSPSAPVMATPPATASAQPAAQAGEEASSGRNKYLLPAAIVVGGAAVIGGAIAIANSGGGGGGSKDSSGNGSSGSGSNSGSSGGSSATGTVTNGNYGGPFSICFEPAATVSNAITHCENGIVSLYVENSTVSIVGLWDTEISASLVGSTFTAESTLPARGNFPDAHLIVAGNIASSTASAHIVGYSTDLANPGDFSGDISATRH